MATGGACGLFTPPIGHFCGGSNGAGGAVISAAQLPGQPYGDPSGATITAMHGGLWCSFAYGVGGYAWDPASKSGSFAFSEGGQQCSRLEGGHGALVVEGVLEELDEPGEFHWDPKTQVLTLWHNATAGTPPPTDGSLEVVQLRTLVNASGSQQAPLAGLSLRRLGFRDTADSRFAPHIAPTGGDWAVNREAAVTASGADGLSVVKCTFWRLDNAGVFLGGFHRNATIADSHFGWLGESAIVSVGDTVGAVNETSGDAFPGFGVDGSAGDQPRGTAILRNVAREIGIVNKQSALYFQAATDGSTVEGNVAFNGARSGINFNDCFGGGSRVVGNVLFNLNRETADHGCFNAWDRLPFYPGKSAAHRDLLARNLLLSNFNSYNGLDTDDDSAYFHMQNNVLLYGHFLKSDYSGHSIEYDGDLGVFTGPSNQYQPVPADYPNAVHDCKMISETDGDNLISQVCPNATDWPDVQYVEVFSPSAKTTVCGQPLEAWQAQGKLETVTAARLPPDAATIVAWSRATLGMPLQGHVPRGV
jgi:hypothetical protein